MLNIFLLLLYFLIAAVSGRVLSYHFLAKQEIVPPLVAQLLTGHLVITSLYAIGATQGKTYLVIPTIGLLFLFLAGSFFRKSPAVPLPNKHFNWKLSANISNTKMLTVIFAALIIGFLSMYFRVYDFSGMLKKIHTDFTFYGGVSDFMNRFGMESLILDPIKPSSSYQPYHYFELWNAAMFARILGTPALQSLMLLTYSFHIALIIIGFYEYIKLKKLKIGFLFVLIFLLFTSPLGYLLSYILESTPLTKLGFISEHGILTKMGMKLFGVHALSILYLYIFAAQEKINFYTIIFLGCLLFIYPTTVPLGGLFLLLYWSSQFLPPATLQWRSWLFKSYLPLLALLVSGTAVLLRGAFIYSAYEIFRYIASFVLIGLIFIIKSPRNELKKTLLMLFLSIGLAVAGLRILMPYYAPLQDPNILQIISNFADPFILIGMIAIIIQYLESANKIVLYGAVVLIMLLYFGQGHFNQAFRRSLMRDNIDLALIQQLNIKEGINTAFVRPLADYSRTTTSWNIYYDIPLHNMRWFTSNYFPICLSLPTAEMYAKDANKKRWYESIVTQSSYYQYLQEQRVNNSASPAELEKNFINRYQIIEVIDNPKR